MARATYFVSGLFLELFSLVGITIGVISIVDPTGTKMADDGYPYGSPTSLMGSVAITVFFVLLSGVGL